MKIIKSENFIYLSIIASPLYLLRFEFFGIPTNLLEIIILITFLVWLLEKNCFKFNYTKILFLIILLFLGLISSAILKENHTTSFGIIKGWFVFPILFGFIVYNKINSLKKSKNILFSMFLSSFIVSLFSLIFYYYPTSLTFDNRLRFFYPSPNYLAMFLAPGILVSFYVIPFFKNAFWGYFMLAIMILSFYLTFSYAAWFSVFLSSLLSILFIKNIFQNRKKFRLIFLSIFLILILFIFLQADTSKFQDLINLEERSSLSSRIIIWKSSFKILSDNYLLGIGAGNFQEKYLDYQQYFPPYLEWAVPQPHNLYIAFWLQSGLIGFLAFVGMIYFWIKIILFNILKAKNDSKKRLAITLLVTMSYILIHGLVDTTYWKNDLSLFFWIIFFLALKTSQIKPSSLLKKKLFR
jgi:O-antigen ligase